MQHTPEYAIPNQICHEGLVKDKNARMDDRIRVSEDKLRSYPYNCLCFLACCDPIQDIWSFGTILAISEWYGLTAAHLLIRISKQHQVLDFSEKQIFPVAHGEINVLNSFVGEKKGMINIADHRMSNKFLQTHDYRQKVATDLALVKFKTPIDLKQYCKLTKVNQNDLHGTKVKVVGYPWQKMSKGERGGRIVQAYEGTGEIVDVSHKYSTLDHFVNTSKGQSGSPILSNIFGNQVIVGIHNNFNKEKNVNSGVLFTEKVLMQISDWIWELQTPLFLIKNFSNGKIFDSQQFIQSHSSKLSNSTNNSSLKEGMKEQTPFFFFWDIKSFQKNNLTIIGKKVQKKSLSKSHTMICSYEEFPKNHTTYCTIKIKKLKGEICIGVITEKHKRIVYDEGEHSLVAAERNLATLQISRKDEKTVKEVLKIKQKVDKTSQTFFDEKEYSITLKVDYINKKILFLRNFQKFQSFNMTEQLVKVNLYLSIGIKYCNDQIVVLKE